VNAEAEPRVFTTTRWSLVLAHTVANAADVDDEIRHLCAALAAKT
jgi:hypothetical protein